MEIVELRRVRGTMTWWGGLLLLLVVASLVFGSGTIQVDSGGGSFVAGSGMQLPIAILAPIALYLVAGFATPLALALNRESAYRDIAWTKPVARPVIALRHILVDVAAIVVAYVLMWAAIWIVLTHKGVGIVAGVDALPTILLALGGCLLWYALLLALTAGFSQRTSFLVGVAWPFFLILAGVQNQVGGIPGAVIRVINVVNPFAYLTGSTTSSSGGATIISTWNAPVDARVAIVWLLAVVLCVVATTIWSRREA